MKTAAFSALKGVCGVSNRYTSIPSPPLCMYIAVCSLLVGHTLMYRSQLQQLLIRLGLLQHVETNEVLYTFPYRLLPYCDPYRHEILCVFFFFLCRMKSYRT